MKTSRRSFLKRSASLASLSVLSSSFVISAREGELTGLQLYTVRDDMKKSPMETLKQVASFGYKHVEHANYVDRKFYGWSPKEFRKILDDLGLKMPSGQTVSSEE